MKIVAIIQARVGSTRLPGKVMMKLSGKTVLEQVIDRVKASRRVDEIVVATTVAKKDLCIVELCAKKGVSVFCGSENDVLDRYYQVARLFQSDHIVRITADCPLIDPHIIDQVTNLHLRGKYDYTSNTLQLTYPDGQDVAVMTFPVLAQAWKKARLVSEREHVCPYIYKHPAKFKLKNLAYHTDLSAKRWTLDNPEDYRFIKVLFKNLYPRNHTFGMEEVLHFLDGHPALENINRHLVRNEGYLKSLREDRIVNG
ncbi:MAG: glycosyltransferase family protein [bacterium]|nr:glycosyltransferase family protein [bacterium]